MSVELAIVDSLSASLWSHELIERNDGVQLLLEFLNGYSASILRTDHSYGGPAGLYEIAVVRGGDVVYDTPITDDVIGYLDQIGVIDTALAISKLEAV